MRIVGGELSGRRIDPPKKIDARPTTDFAKESLFNILNNNIYFEDTTVLDLFSGTGSISFEFFSRGSTDITSVDKSPTSYKFISEMGRKLDMQDHSVLRSDVFEYLGKTGGKWDLIFADPPYDLPDIEDIHRFIFQRGLLNPGGMFVLEHGPRTDFSKLSHFVKHKKYGHCNFSFFELEED